MNKKLSIMILEIINSCIILSGITFGIYSFYSKIIFKILNTNVPGYILGLLVIYFGIRNFMSLKKLNKDISGDNIKFSWDNFKSNKKSGNKKKRAMKYIKG